MARVVRYFIQVPYTTKDRAFDSIVDARRYALRFLKKQPRLESIVILDSKKLGIGSVSLENYWSPKGPYLAVWIPYEGHVKELNNDGTLKKGKYLLGWGPYPGPKHRLLESDYEDW